MQINPVGISFRPYIYNTNIVSANSMNKISAIEDDALKSSVDCSNDKNENPLKLGETSNFADVLAMQFQLGQNNAARVMKTAENVEEAAKMDLNTAVIKNADSIEKVEEQTGDKEKLKLDEIFTNTSSLDENTDKNATSQKSMSNLFLINKAIEAYTVSLAV